MTVGNSHILEDILGYTRKVQGSVSGLRKDLTGDELCDQVIDQPSPYLSGKLSV